MVAEKGRKKKRRQHERLATEINREHGSIKSAQRCYLVLQPQPIKRYTSDIHTASKEWSDAGEKRGRNKKGWPRHEDCSTTSTAVIEQKQQGKKKNKKTGSEQ